MSLLRRSLGPAGAAPPPRARISFILVQCHARRRVLTIAYHIRAIAVLLPCSTLRRVCSAVLLSFALLMLFMRCAFACGICFLRAGFRTRRWSLHVFIVLSLRLVPYQFHFLFSL